MTVWSGVLACGLSCYFGWNQPEIDIVDDSTLALSPQRLPQTLKLLEAGAEWGGYVGVFA